MLGGDLVPVGGLESRSIVRVFVRGTEGVSLAGGLSGGDDRLTLVAKKVVNFRISGPRIGGSSDGTGW